MNEHRFGPFVLDTLARRLLCEGRPVHVSPKAFRLLELLVASRPRAWSKQELQERLWPNVAVVEANLPNLVAELRRALRDEADTPRFIRTVPRFGYAFDGGSPTVVLDPSPAHCRLSWAGGSAFLGCGEHLVGRDPEASVVIDEPSVSRRHARITLTETYVTYEDLGSKNGSYRAGARVEAAVRLLDADVVRIGLVDVSVRIYPAAGSTQTSPAG